MEVEEQRAQRHRLTCMLCMNYTCRIQSCFGCNLVKDETKVCPSENLKLLLSRRVNDLLTSHISECRFVGKLPEDLSTHETQNCPTILEPLEGNFNFKRN